MRESTTLRLCRAAQGHSRTPVEGVLQQSPEHPDPEPSKGTRTKTTPGEFLHQVSQGPQPKIFVDLPGCAGG